MLMGKDAKEKGKQVSQEREELAGQEICPKMQEGMGSSPPVEVLVIEGSREGSFREDDPGSGAHFLGSNSASTCLH